MAIPSWFLDELRALVPVSELVGRDVRLTKAGREWRGLSPFNKERTPSFYVNDQKGFYHDFSSGKHGDDFSWLMERHGLQFREAVEEVAKIAGREVPDDGTDDGAPKVDTKPLFEVNAVAAEHFQQALFSPAGEAARGYLASRGITTEIIKQWGIGYAPPGHTLLAAFETAARYGLDSTLPVQPRSPAELPLEPIESVPGSHSILDAAAAAGLLYGTNGTAGDRFRDRIMIPIRDTQNRIVGFGGRAGGDVKPKYLNSPETPIFQKGKILFGLFEARRAIAERGGDMIVVEGYFDVISLAAIGFGGAVAPLGTAITAEQLALAWKTVDEPVLCFDGDGAGRRAAWRAIDVALPVLKPGKSVRFAALPDGQDPDSIARSEDDFALAKVLKRASPLVDVIWKRETEDVAVDTPERQAGLEKRIAGLVDLIKDETLRAHYRRDIRQRTDEHFLLNSGSHRGEPDISFSGVGLFDPDFTEAVASDSVVFLCSEEDGAAALHSIGVPAASAAGGFAKWGPQHSMALRGAEIVVIIGATGTDTAVVCTAVHAHAKRVRTLRLPMDPPAWVAAGNTADKLYAGLDTLAQDWKPEPWKSKFGFLPFEDLDLPGPERSDIIDGLFTEGDRSVVGGPSGSGKSFFMCHAAMCIAYSTIKAFDFFGHKVIAPGLVLYQAGEGTLGVKDRFKAWRNHHGVDHRIRIPLGMLLSPIDIFRPNGDTAALIAECEEIKKLYPGVPLRMLVIDTLATATGGADENSGRDMGTVMINVAKISAALGCAVCLVHHMNAGGTKLRGHTSIYANVDTVFLITDDAGIRTAVLDKQKDGERGIRIDFKLFPVDIRQREIDGKRLKSCVTIPLVKEGGQAGVVGDKKPALSYGDPDIIILRCLTKALSENGEPRPAGIANEQVRHVIRIQHWYNAYYEIAPSTLTKSSQNKRLERAEAKFISNGVMGKKGEYVWLTGKPVARAVTGTRAPEFNGPTAPPAQETMRLEDELGRDEK